jgi:hypothetical protein
MKKMNTKIYAYALMLVLMGSCTKSEDLLIPKNDAENGTSREQNISKIALDTPYKAIDTPYRKTNYAFRVADTPYKAIDTPYRKVNIAFRVADTPYKAIDTPYRYTKK